MDVRSKIKLLFTLRDGVPAARLDAALTGEIDRLRSTTGGTWAFARGAAIQDEELHHVAAGAFDAAEHPFDAMLEVVPTGSLADAIPLFEGLAERLSGIVDPATSAALAGTEHVILPGDGALFVLITNRRLPGFTHQGFIDYWLGYHGPFAREHTPPEVGMGYRQFHTDEPLTAALLNATGFAVGDFDGAAECHYFGADAVRLLMGKTEVVDQATEDELKFVDHDRCVTSLFEITPDSTSHLGY